MVVINAMAREYTKVSSRLPFLIYGIWCQIGEVVDVEDDLVAMMSGGVLDVDTKMM